MNDLAETGGRQANSEEAKAETVSLLQDLGLKEYEARCFTALTQVATGTAKEISDMSEVPRTRVYDAIRVLEAEGLVEIQHTNPQKFRAVGIEEAARTLRRKYDDRIDTLQSTIDDIDVQEDVEDPDRMQEVWSLAGRDAIESRTIDSLGNAESEIVLLVVEEEILSDALFDELAAATDRGVSVIVGGLTDAVVDRFEAERPDLNVFETELDWLVGPEAETEVAISRLLLVDRASLLVSSFYPDTEPESRGVNEQAVFASGLENGLVVLIRRLISSGLERRSDPAL